MRSDKIKWIDSVNNQSNTLLDGKKCPLDEDIARGKNNNSKGETREKMAHATAQANHFQPPPMSLLMVCACLVFSPSNIADELPCGGSLPWL